MPYKSIIPCTIEGCGGRIVARGLCTRHYARWRKHGSTELPERVLASPVQAGHRACKDCGATKALGEFYFNARRDSYSGRCKECYRAAGAMRRNGVMPPTTRKTAPPGMWQCSACGELKIATQFNRDSTKAHGHSYTCKSCATAYQREWKEAPDTWRYRRDYYLRRYFGISLDDYERLYEAQGGRCAICGGEGNDVRRTRNVAPLFVDHCHATGAVRGLLCQRCNTGIAMLQDDPAILAQAIQYLAARPDPVPA